MKVAQKFRWLVRGKPGVAKDEWIEADYTDEEYAFLNVLRKRLDDSSLNQQEQQEIMNTVTTLHEFKVLLDARLVPLDKETKKAARMKPESLF